MSNFDIYVKVSILNNCKTTSPSFCQSVNIYVEVWHLCRSLTFMSKLVYLPITRLNNHQTLHKTSWLCDIGVRFSARLSTVISKFDIYVKVIILINYKTKQPSNLAWNISLTSWLCDIGIPFSVCPSVRPSQHLSWSSNLRGQQLCRTSTFMSELVF